MPSYPVHSFGADAFMSSFMAQQKMKMEKRNQMFQAIMGQAQLGALDKFPQQVLQEFQRMSPAQMSVAKATNQKAALDNKMQEYTAAATQMNKLMDMYDKMSEYSDSPIVQKSLAKMGEGIAQATKTVFGESFDWNGVVGDAKAKRKAAGEAARNKIDQLTMSLTPDNPNKTETLKQINIALGALASSGYMQKDALKGYEDSVRAQIQLVAEETGKMDAEKKRKQVAMENTPVQVRDTVTGVVATKPKVVADNMIARGGKRYELVSELPPDKATSMGNREYPALAEAYATGWFPSRRLSVGEMNAMEAGLQKRMDEGLPIDAEYLRDMEFNTLKNASTGRSAGSRLVVARKQNINTAFELLDDMEKTGSKLDYNDTKFVGQLEKFKNGQLNDPIFTEYMTQRADALFVLGNALKQNGLTDKSIAVEEEAATPTMSPKALKAWVNVQRRALNRSAEELGTDYKYDMKRVPTAEPGMGGQGPKTMPGAVSDMETWIAEAMRAPANKGVSRQQLEEYYKSKYGGR